MWYGVHGVFPKSSTPNLDKYEIHTGGLWIVKANELVKLSI